MRYAWEELKKGWKDAIWGDYFLLALFPVVFITALLDYLVTGAVCGPLFWVLAIAALPVALFWAGLRSGPYNWLGRFVLALSLVLLAWLLIKQMLRKGQNEGRFTRRIGRAEVTIPITIRPESEEVASVAQPLPSWWQRAQTALETISAAFHTAAHASWTPATTHQ